MSTEWKLVVVGLVLVAVGGALALKPAADAGSAAGWEAAYDPSAPVPIEPVPESYDASGGVQRVLDWNEGSGAADTLRKVSGVLVVLAGVYLVYQA